jgi:DNA-cytosine methyltransferase
MNVLSLFDGMSCGRIALDKLGIKVDKYFASEIDKYAIKVSEANYPDIVRLGDVRDVRGEDLPKIDLMIAGSPCQGFSFAGKQLAFDDPRSALFFEFTRLLDECKPKYFLLENVRMKKEHLQVITDLLGVEPILINSSLVSAQNRKRYYWTNIPGVEQPKDKGIVLKDILESGNSADLVGNNGKKLLKEDIQKGSCLLARDYKGFNTYGMTGVRESYTADNIEVKKKVNPKYYLKEDSHIYQRIKNNHPWVPRIPNENEKSNCLVVGGSGQRDLVEDEFVNNSNIRRLTILERERLQTVPDNYTKAVSDTHRYKMLGNGWTIDVITHILKNISIPTTPLRVGTAIDMKGHDMHKRIYSEEGKSPTLLVDSRSPKIPTSPIKVGMADDINGHDYLKRIYSPNGKSPTLTTCGGGNTEPKVSVDLNPASIVGRRINDRGVREDYNKDVPITQCLQVKHNSDKSGCLTTVDKDNVVSSEEPGRYVDVYNDSKLFWRKLTPLECERLQTVPDGYTSSVSNSQRYKMLGNGWTVDVIAHIFEGMKDV